MGISIVYSSQNVRVFLSGNPNGDEILGYSLSPGTIFLVTSPVRKEKREGGEGVEIKTKTPYFLTYFRKSGLIFLNILFLRQ